MARKALLILSFILSLSLGAELLPPNEFVVALNELEVEFDPHHSIYASEAQIFTALYEGLFVYDPQSLEPVKASCSSFARSKDGLVYTFKIREEARWSDGSALKASDFRDAWLRALSPAEKADYAAFFDVIAGAKEYRLGLSKNASAVGVKALDDRTLEVSLAAPAAYFTRLLCHHSFAPIHPSLLKETDWSKRLPIPVNGPYLVKRSGKGLLELEKNPLYWDTASVSIPAIKILLSDDDEEMTRLYDNGEIHWLAGPMDLEALLSEDSLQFNAMFGTTYWFFDCAAPPFDKEGVRRALALLLPWDEIRNPDTYFSPAETLVLPLEEYGEAKGIARTDREEAMRLLSEAGFPEGKGLPPFSILVPAEGEDANRVAGIMKAAWEKLAGFKVELKTIPFSRYLEVARAGPAKGNYGLGLTTWIGDFADPLAFLQMWESDSNLNDARFRDPEYDRLLAESSSLEGEKRLSALAAAETRLLQSAACLPINHSLAVNVIDMDFIQGWHSNALDIHPFKELSFGQPRIRPGVVRK